MNLMYFGPNWPIVEKLRVPIPNQPPWKPHGGRGHVACPLLICPLIIAISGGEKKIKGKKNIRNN